MPLSQNFAEKAKNGAGVLDVLRLKSIDIVVLDIMKGCLRIKKQDKG
jgi:hypothetical protein